MMKPFDQVAELYERYPQPRAFEEDISAHIETGYVVSTPEFFLMGRAVDRYADPAMIEDPWHGFLRSEQNAWLVYAFAGSSRNFLSFVPYPLRWVGFQRRNQPLKWHDSAKIFHYIRPPG
jgi:hypothetical protein